MAHVLLMDVHSKSVTSPQELPNALRVARPLALERISPFGHLEQKNVPLRAGVLERSQHGIALAHAWRIA